MHAWILHEEKEGNIFMNINEQTVSRNLNQPQDRFQYLVSRTLATRNYSVLFPVRDTILKAIRARIGWVWLVRLVYGMIV